MVETIAMIDNPSDSTSPNQRVGTRNNISTDTVALVLTATIDPGSMISTVRSDPAIRLKDYQHALQLWLHDPSFRNIIFCENSGSDLSPLMDVSTRFNPYQKKIEFLSFEEQKSASSKGKCFGEIGILNHVLRQSQILRETTHLVKMTGRLYVTNAAKLAKQMNTDDNTFVFCNIGQNMTYAECRVFGAHKDFFENYLLPLRDACDEPCGINMERIVARAVHRAMADGLTWSMMPIVPFVRGFSGTHGTEYKNTLFRHAVAEITRQIKVHVARRR